MSENNKKTSKKKSEILNNDSSTQVEINLEETTKNVLELEELPKENLKDKKKSFEDVDSLPSTNTKTSWIWIRDTNGRPSMSATFASVAFWVTTIAYVLSIFESVGPLKFRAFDVGACGAYLVPILTLYFSRRWSADKIDIDKLKSESNAAKSSKKEAENNE